MGKLPDLPYRGGLSRSTGQAFGGYDHREQAFGGMIYDMANLSSRLAPYLATRRPRRRIKDVADLNGLFTVENHLITVEGELVKKNGNTVGAVKNSKKTFAVLGDRLIIYPDKVYVNYAAKGDFLTLVDLQLTVTDAKYGDVYAVGQGTPYDLYYWDGKDWMFYEKEFGSLESSLTTRVTFLAQGELYGEPAYLNSLHGFNARWAEKFSVGDAVTISGCNLHPENNLTAIIRGIDGDTLQFYENLFTTDTVHQHRAAETLPAADYSFTVDGTTRGFRAAAAIPEDDVLTWNGTALTSQSGVALTLIATTDGEELSFTATAADYVENRPVTVSRTVPDLDFLCSANNRLWGCIGDTIHCSKLGDPFNFQVFDSLSTDSWSVNSGSPGDFTACCAYLGYPLFFKEDRIYKVYGSRPAEFQLVDSMTMGVAKGSENSLAIADETLFYLSPQGVVCYNGGVPASLAAPFGNVRYHHGIAAAGEGKYTISMADDSNTRHLFTYDVAKGLWHREDSLEVTHMAKAPQGIYLAADDVLWQTEGDAGTAEDPVRWQATLGPFLQNTPDHNTIARLTLRLLLAENSTFRGEIRCDDGHWLPAGQVQNGKLSRSVTLPMVPRRCESFWLHLSGEGECCMQSLTMEYTAE